MKPKSLGKKNARSSQSHFSICCKANKQRRTEAPVPARLLHTPHSHPARTCGHLMGTPQREGSAAGFEKSNFGAQMC